MLLKVSLPSIALGVIALAGAEPQVPAKDPPRTKPLAATDGPVIIYDEALSLRSLERLAGVGAKRYYIVYQNDCDPDVATTGKIDVARLARHVSEQTGHFPSEWGVLDFETPFDDWIKEGPDSERCRIAVASMVAAIERMRSLFPDVKWAYYGVPRLDFYPEGKTWVTAPEDVRRKVLEEQFAKYAPIIAKSDWLCPSVYMVVGDRADGGRPGPEQRNATRAWTDALVRASIDFGNRVGNRVPVVPFVSPAYQPGGGARIRSLIPAGIIDECTISPILDAGGSGACIWTAGAYFVAQAVGNLPPGKERDPEAVVSLKNWSEDFGEPESFLRSPDGVASMRSRFADATASMAEQFAKAWGLRRTAAPSAPSTAVPGPPPKPASPQ